jgi:8-oxo-dGTP diphosphatase
LPGGGIEAEEKQEECITREFKEETGYDIEVKQFIGQASSYRFCEGLNGYRHLIGFFYIVDLKAQTAIPIEEDELLWMELIECSKALYLEHQAWAVKEALGEKCE